MSLKTRLAKIFVYAVLELGALCGVPMRPDQIEKIMRLMDRAVVTDVLRNEDDEPAKPD
ncbi:MAG TPA: hypothetical protein VGF40_18740 [Thermoanaerobaculia bacterium]